ncbi:TlpA disulfide reductase family protein [Mucilaginibacter sp.]|jgi:alkyl hydroperoxide reductase subunit AhpC|uniref:TlpA disulfide reductase family protein n=1 Tax=Mucilaginibacter sp. TaxID=1882438 RepID=UPI002608B885|nr:TlpA disulfide reductase family protein [Mucilaginibacter sp.]MDB5128892.1 hypothetical protein [Mucilaginibacter sp.]
MHRNYIKYFIISFFLVFTVSAFGQVISLKKFSIEGTINADTGTINMYLVADSSYFPAGVRQLSSKIIDHKFRFEGSIPYPVGVQLAQNNSRYQSGLFVITPGNQTIICNTDSNRITPQVQNHVMHEYNNVYNPAFAYLKKESLAIKMYEDSLNTLYNKKIPDSLKAVIEQRYKKGYSEHDKTLLQYTLSHPNSYFAFWQLVRVSIFGYENIFEQIYNAFSPDIKNTYTGKYLYKRLHGTSSLLVVGTAFSNIECATSTDKKMTPDVFAKNKYTLVDFWYSHCTPCIGQFADLKAIYQQYHADGFEMAGISTDAIKYRTNWLNVIKVNNLPWLQYWDKNGTEATRLSIEVFPTNFLVNNKGIIVAKNLRPAEVKQFLKENLKQ